MEFSDLVNQLLCSITAENFLNSRIIIKCWEKTLCCRVCSSELAMDFK